MRFGGWGRRRLGLGLCLVLVALSLPVAALAADEVEVRSASLVRTVFTSEFGVTSPRGLAYVPAERALVVTGTSGAGGIPSVRLSVKEDVLGSVTLPAGEALTAAFDVVGDRLALVSGSDLVSVDAGELARPRPRAERASASAARLQVPAGAAFDAAGDLVVLDARARALVRVVGGNPARGVTQVPLGALGEGDLRGLAFDASTGLWYVGAPAERRVYAVDGQGELQAVYVLSPEVSWSDPQGMVIAPTSDSTDDPARMSLFVADAGSDGGGGSVSELSLSEPVAFATVPSTGQWIQTIDTSVWQPPSPDPAGVVWMPDRGRLMVSDSEVNEMHFFAGVNLYETTTTGHLQATGVTTQYSGEPTGVGYRESDRTLFVSDDNADRINMVRPDASGGYGRNAPVTFLSTRPHSDDPEDVAYDSSTGDLFIIDGVNSEVYRVSRGADGTFGTADDVWSNFDMAQFGAVDPEGIDYDPVRGTLVVVDQRSRAAYEVTKSGSLVQIISIPRTTVNMVAAAGVAVAPGSSHSGRSLYIADRVVDNGADPNENDGRIYEIVYDGVTQPGNNPPQFQQDLQDRVNTVGDTVSLSADATDADGDALTWAATGLPSGVTINSSTGQISGTISGSAQVYNTSVSVTDGTATVFDTFTWTVLAEGGNPPSGNPPSVAGVGTVYNTAGSNLTAHPVALPANTAVGDLLMVVFPYDGGGGANWPAGWNEIVDRQNGSHGLAVAYRVATGSEGSTVTVSTVAEQAVGFSYRIVDWHGSQPPEVAWETGTSATPDPPRLSPSWPGGDTLWIAAYGINGGPSTRGPSFPLPDRQLWARTGGGGASGGAVASRVVNSTALDPDPFSDTNTDAWVAATIAVRPAPSEPGGNRPPVFNQDLPNRSDEAGATVSFSAAASDPDGDALTYAATGLPAGVSINTSSGLISGTIAGSAAGTYNTLVSVTDGSATVTDTFTWTVTAPAPTNNPPVFNQDLPNRSDEAGATVSFSAAASDPDGDALTYAATGLPAGVSINTSSGLISGTIAGSAAGTYNTLVSVTDGSATVTDTFTWTVTAPAPTNNPPVFNQDLPNRSDEAGATVSFSAAASDPDGDTLTYAATGLPAGVSINTATGLISGTIGADAAGTYSTTVAVTDGSATVEDSFTWTVIGISFRSSTTQSARNATSLGLARPAGAQSGDRLVAAVSVRGTTTITAPSGWTLVRSDAQGTSMHQAVYSRVVGSGEPTSYTWSLSPQTPSATGILLAYTAVNTSGVPALDVSSGAGNAASGAITAPSLTASVEGTRLIGFFGTATNAAITEPSGMTERAEVMQNAGKDKLTFEAADALLPARASGTRTATASSVAVNVGQLVTLRLP